MTSADGYRLLATWWLMATGWIVYLIARSRPVGRASAVVVLGAEREHARTTFGLAGTAQVAFAARLPSGEESAAAFASTARGSPWLRDRAATATYRGCSRPCIATACERSCRPRIKGSRFSYEGALSADSHNQSDPVHHGPAPESADSRSTGDADPRVDCGEPSPRHDSAWGRYRCVGGGATNVAHMRLALYCPTHDPNSRSLQGSIDQLV